MRGIKARGWVRGAVLLSAALCALGAGSGLSAQELPCAWVDTWDDVARVSGNAVQGYVQTSVSGTCMYDWAPAVSGEIWKEDPDQFITDSGSEIMGLPGGLVWYEFETTALSQWGPGTYTVWGFHRAYNEGFDQWAPPYWGGWDGWDGWSIGVTRPTIEGLGCNGLMWYLGSGTTERVLAQDGNYYIQAYDLTFNNNCNAGDNCPETPQWTITPDQGVPIQATLTPESGQTVKISTGPNSGDCEWHTRIKASIGGFETEESAVLVNSPKYMVDQIWRGLGETVQWEGDVGYVSRVYWVVADACETPNALLGLPLHGTFGTFSNPGVNSGWPNPDATHAPVFNYNMYTFRDSIGANSYSYDPFPIFTVGNPPFTYNTVLKYAPQTWRVGSETSPSGTQVFSGTISYYRDHGTSSE
jgi:hypothetical protein